MIRKIVIASMLMISVAEAQEQKRKPVHAIKYCQTIVMAYQSGNRPEYKEQHELCKKFLEENK